MNDSAPAQRIHHLLAEAWRRRQELLRMLEMAASQAVDGPTGWAMSLRNAHERHVAVGSIFSGLFVSIQQPQKRMHMLSTVRSPADWDCGVGHQNPSAGTTGTALYNKATVTTGRQLGQGTARRWEDAPYLATRLAALQRQLRAIQPHAPVADQLAISGISAEAAAWAACQGEVTLADAEELLASREPALYAQYEVGGSDPRRRLSLLTDT